MYTDIIYMRRKQRTLLPHTHVYIGFKGCELGFTRRAFIYIYISNSSHPSHSHRRAHEVSLPPPPSLSLSYTPAPELTLPLLPASRRVLPEQGPLPQADPQVDVSAIGSWRLACGHGTRAHRWTSVDYK